MASSSSPLDPAVVRRIARLARIRLADEDVAQLQTELGSIIGWIEQLDEVDVSGVDPLANIGAASMTLRDDVVTDGDQVDAVLANAPARSGPFFTVPKVVE
ncbi:Asp-tRNA(Asn)/Glu-tRNA(Gln) amidotransferase subunit GatC [Acidisoma cellulosilytica]|uniref:Aspartyl/glutamyl-tRNA(Asn/Gln) amidotransferase subunit C n=1 Tax=Acidisoma cellulosilyticum TaxID=2802395 RepID=A0A963Z348_9PROT|nr:Asp-tRNA(Asn)/Glu-tRNA(Gln) amidotransferase subunit GatC [Acidisoma cellulosilyticum]MCB8881666.1 Asp-tRNA(Asn)/Glu-tRNA(Gln) amidotransferase subunit GatC [Acidisoma cellulosilyticum]